VTDISQIRHWHTSTRTSSLYEGLLGTLGTDQFGANVRDAVQALTAGAMRIYLFEATDREHSSLQYFHGEPGLPALFPAYCRWYQQQDPVSDAYAAAPRCSDFALQRVRPMHIASAGFRRRIFDEPGIVERISVIQRGPDGWRVMNVGRHVSDGCCTDEEIDALVGLACLVLPMLPLNRQRAQDPRSLSVEELELRFARRFGLLSTRERQVCARAAAGLGVADTARELGIAETSVLTYRQRAYQRLQVASSLALRALVTH
jgi:DNA-binding CsgD family transcriptional regulator